MALSASVLLTSHHSYSDNSNANKMKSAFLLPAFHFFFLVLYSAFEFRGLSTKRESQKFTVVEVGTSLVLYCPFGKMAGFYDVKSIVLLKTNISCPA